MTAKTFGHRLLLRLESRNHVPCSFQAILSTSLFEWHVSIEKDTVDLQHIMVWSMRSPQARPTLDGNHGIEALGFRAEVQRAIEATIHAKDSPSYDDGTAVVAVVVAVFGG